MQILGVANSYASAPVNAPTSLSNVPSATSVAISFTAPTNDGGAAITNYEYSFNNSTWTALSPADATSPVTVSGLSTNAAYTVYLRAVNIVGSGPASSATTFTTLAAATGGAASPVAVNISGTNYNYLTFNATGTLTVNAATTMVVYSFGGGNGGGGDNGYNGFQTGAPGGGNGTITKTSLAAGTYTITVGGGGSAGSRGGHTSGTNSYFGTDNTVGGTYGVAGAAGNGGAAGGNGGAGTQVNTFIGGASLFKAAGGGGRGWTSGGSGIGGNGAVYPSAGGTAAANTASGGGSGQGSGQPNLYQGIGGGGGSGVVYVRWVV